MHSEISVHRIFDGCHQKINRLMYIQKGFGWILFRFVMLYHPFDKNDDSRKNGNDIEKVSDLHYRHEAGLKLIPPHDKGNDFDQDTDDAARAPQPCAFFLCFAR